MANDPSPSNVVITVGSFLPVVGEAIGALTAVQDVGSLAGQWITNAVIAPIFSAASGEGARIWGGRWNPPGIAAIYASSNPPLVALEVLVHYETLPLDYILTLIEVPDHLAVETVPDERLPADWNHEISDPIALLTPGKQEAPAKLLGSQVFGSFWLAQKRSVALSVPSSVMGVGYPSERNFVLNPEHPAFAQIRFLPSLPFAFDPRLK